MTSCDALKLVDATNIRLAEPIRCPRLDNCAIHRHSFFHNLSDEDLATLCQRSRLHRLETRQMLCREGEPAQRFFIVLSGQLKLYRVSDQGSERILGSAGPGEVLGEMPACAPEGTYPWYAQCLENTEVRSFSGSLLRDMVGQRTDYMMNIMSYMSDAARVDVNAREILSSQNARDRLVNYILQRLPEDRRVPQEMEFPLPKGLTASLLAMQPETLSRVLSDLRRKGLVDVEQRRVRVHDRETLASLSS
jgi:CRP-like cAMP-binding protein